MIESLVEQFATLDDPRCASKVEHRLIDVLVIAVCAVIAEAETFEDIALYGRCKEAWLRGFLELPGGIPSHDTFRGVLMLIDPDAFEPTPLSTAFSLGCARRSGPRLGQRRRSRLLWTVKRSVIPSTASTAARPYIWSVLTRPSAA